MLYAVLVFEEPFDGVPRGAAVLAHGRDHRAALVYHNPREPFGERCARAAQQPRPIPVPGPTVGRYDSIDGGDSTDTAAASMRAGSVAAYPEATSSLATTAQTGVTGPAASTTKAGTPRRCASTGRMGL